MKDLVKSQLKEIKKIHLKNNSGLYNQAVSLYDGSNCQVLTHAPKYWDILISSVDDDLTSTASDTEVRINFSTEEIYPTVKSKRVDWSPASIAALMEIDLILTHDALPSNKAGKVYTREGMVKRVLAERREKAEKAKYKIKFADNIYGEHTLINEKGVQYGVTLRDFDTKTGYINNPDLQTNKLGTTKHIMYAFKALEAKPQLFKKLSKNYPFVEVFLDPLNDYRISWFYPHPVPPKIDALLKKHFGKKQVLADAKIKGFMTFLKDAKQFSKIKIRPEVEQTVQKAWDAQVLDKVRQKAKIDFSFLKAELFPYQKTGVEFATFRDGAILADEMGLGKTIQAIAIAILKKQFFGFEKCLIVCPASLKEQWKREIEKFSHEQAVIVQGLPKERQDIYLSSGAYFVIVNYETVLRDLADINHMGPDFIILDEAQRIKNFTTITAQNIKRLQKRHALVITGTPIENRLTDLYSIMQFVQPGLLTPLWEFSYQHCFFDEFKKDKITGYYNLQQLKDRLKSTLLRREKSKVLKDLPKVTEITVPIAMSLEQAEFHASYAKSISVILHKKFISPFDLQRLMLLLANMRMVCDSTFLVDKETHHSPKLVELEHILLEKINILQSDRKIIIFSEWTQMLHLIGKMLQKNGIGFAQLSGQVAVKNRGLLVKKFETDANCKVFLSTEAGGSGLNLQVADTVINFELPWNPAKKNQRIGRIDRLGQLKKQLTVINLVTQHSIEVKIASGLLLKQSLFDGVLSTETGPDFVDFSTKGKAQFLQELESMMAELSTPTFEQEDAKEAQQSSEQHKEAVAIGEVIEAEQDDKMEANANSSNTATSANAENASDQAAPTSTAQLEAVLNNGMDFLSGLMQMATGKNVGLENKKVEIDQATGEVVMRFKLPSF